MMPEIQTAPPQASDPAVRSGDLLDLVGEDYEVIYADPPWQYADRNCNGSAEQHYRTMPLDAIKALPVSQIAADDAVLLMWATWPLMPEAMELITAWGFKYKTIGFNWIKRNRSDCGFFFGLGRWTRGNAEPCLLATRGKPKRVGNAVSQLIFEPIGRHSAKPPGRMNQSSMKSISGSKTTGLRHCENQMPTLRRGHQPRRTFGGCRKRRSQKLQRRRAQTPGRSNG